MRITILLVEDDRSQAWLVRKSMRSHAAQPPVIHHTETLAEALHRLKGAYFDVILLDLNLPDSSGLSTFRRVAQAQPAAAVVVLTSNDDEALAIQAVREGAQDYQVKGDVKGGTLVRSVRYAIERRRRQAAEEQLLAVQEEERKRVARELHDGVIQSLVAVRLQVQRLAEHLEEQHPSSAHVARMIASEAGSAAEEVRRLSRDLHPSVLDRRRLGEAICWYGGKLQSEAGVSVEFEVQPHDPLDPATKQHLFRIFQETMRNAIQHSGAAKIHVSLRYDGDAILLLIEDDGRGFKLDVAAPGLGLTSIRERAELLRAALRIDARPGFGTLVSVRVPLRQTAAAREMA